MTAAAGDGGDEAAGGIGESLASAARAILADVRKALSDARLSDAEQVHEVRKAFKRWRALLRLLSGPIGKPADAMRGQARDLMRALSGSRDGQAALDALADLRKSELPLSPTSVKTIEARLAKVRGDVEAANFTPELRQRLNDHLDAATLAIDGWPLAAIEFDAIADELTFTYRRARRLLPDKWLEAKPDDLHELRKRVVEHRHQMELVEPLWPRLARIWAQEAQRLRERLGATQDLAVFDRLMAPRQLLAPWRSRLTFVTADRRTAHLNAAAKLASRLFAEKPKAFRARIGALWQAKNANSG